MRVNHVFNTSPPAIVRQVGETREASRWTASQALTEREIVIDFFKKGIAIIDKSHKNLHQKYPRMFEK
jgi:hypothetical protein